MLCDACGYFTDIIKKKEIKRCICNNVFAVDTFKKQAVAQNRFVVDAILKLKSLMDAVIILTL